MGTTAYTSLCNEGSFHEDLLLIGFTDGVECAAGVLEEADLCEQARAGSQ